MSYDISLEAHLEIRVQKRTRTILYTLKYYACEHIMYNMNTALYNLRRALCACWMIESPFLAIAH